MPDAIPSNLTGQIPPGYDPAYGGAPLIPDPVASMWQAIGGDAAAMPNLTNLANIYNLFNYNQQAGQVAGTPGFENVLSNLHGQLPQDVIGELSQGAAERGIGSGQAFGDSPNANAAYLRALGTNSLALQNRGQEQYGNLLGHFPKPADLDMSQFFVSPEAQQAANAAANVSAAAPNPRAAADEEMRRLLESIAAGKAGVPSGVGGVPGVSLGGGGSGGVSRPGPSGTMVGGALNKGGGSASNLWTAGPANAGRPPDAAQGAAASSGSGWNLGRTSPDISSFLNNTVFGPPGYENSNILGAGLDPTLNAIFGTAPADTTGFGSPITAPDLWAGSTGGNMFAGGGQFGSAITSPNLSLGGSGSGSAEDEFDLLFPYEDPMASINKYDRSLFGQPITHGGDLFNTKNDWWTAADPIAALFGSGSSTSGSGYDPNMLFPYEDPYANTPSDPFEELFPYEDPFP